MIRRAGLIFGATTLAYLPSLRGGMIWDDDAHVTRAGLRSLHGLWRIWTELGATQQYYPVVHSAFWLEHRLWGDATLGYHLLNVGLHATSACLFALILGKLLGSPRDSWAPWLAGLIFALHPVCVESVAWISEQKNTLSTVFYLLAALLYLRFDGQRGQASDSAAGRTIRGLTPYLLATLLFVLALLTKSVTATLPAALLVVIWWKRGRLGLRRDMAPLLPWFAMGAAAGMFTAWVERSVNGAQGAAYRLTPAQHLLLAGRMEGFYLAKLVWPANLIFIYPHWNLESGEGRQGLCLLAMAALFAGCLAALKRTRGLLAAALFFTGSLFPALGFFNVYPFIYSYVADHFQYLASLGVFALVGAGCARWRPMGAVAIAASGMFAFLTWRQCRMYRDGETLYRAVLARNPACAMAYNNLGTLLQARGDIDAAVADYRNVLLLQPDNAGGHNNLGSAYLAEGRTADAAAEFREALRLKPGDAEAHNNLGAALLKTGDPARAILQCEEALRLKPRFADAYHNLGNAWLVQGSLNEAMSAYRTALRIDPNLPEASLNLGLALAKSGRLPEAIARYRETLRLRPDYPEAHNNLGNALLASGRLPEAIEQCEAALRLRPGYAEAYFNLGVALALSGRRSEAVSSLEAALRLRPDYGAARTYLAGLRN